MMRFCKLLIFALILQTLLICASPVSAREPANTNQQPQVSILTEKARLLLDSWRGQSSILEAAKKEIDAALAVNSSSPSSLKELARYYIMDGYINNSNYKPGSLSKAEAALNKAIAADPGFVGSYILFGHLYLQMNRLHDAKTALSKADQIGSEDPWLQLNWADVLIKEGKFDEAIERYNKVIDAGTTNRKAMLVAFGGMINYYYALNKFDQVDATYKKQIAYEPTSAWTYGNYANFLLCAMDKYDDAITQARKALSLMEFGMGRFVLGSALYRRWAHLSMFGEPGEATAALKEARAVFPDIEAVVANAKNCSAMATVEQVLRTPPQ